MTAHPRSRGENQSFFDLAVNGNGSSPLTRGKPSGAFCSAPRSGLIPAHAGKTTDAAHQTVSSQAHPRSRGENHRRSAPNGVKSGSSPLTRGKPTICMRGGVVQRLIPAHAGKTPPRSAGLTGAWAHPRSRGENQAVTVTVPADAGSSPLTRGKPDPPGGGRPRCGLIPAHAGKTKRGQSTS